MLSRKMGPMLHPRWTQGKNAKSVSVAEMPVSFLQPMGLGVELLPGGTNLTAAHYVGRKRD